MNAEKTAIKNSILSFILGDALGLAVQFIPQKILKKKLQEKSLIEIIESGTNSNIPLGTWSDDSSLILCTMASIVESNEINLENISEKFHDWFQNGYLTPNNKAFDIGRTTYQAISNYIKNNNKTLIGDSSVESNGNGSLMRILPVAIFCWYQNLTKSELLKIIQEVSSLTHAHPISIIGCYIYTAIVYMILNRATKEDVKTRLKDIKNDFPKEWGEYLAEYENIFNENVAFRITPTTKPAGYIVNTLEIVLWGFFNSNFIEDGIFKIIELGGDKDTNGAIGGGLCGLYYGLRGIEIGTPFIKNQKDLTDIIIKKDIILSIIESFIKLKDITRIV